MTTHNQIVVKKQEANIANYWAHKTSSSPSLFIEVAVPSQLSHVFM